MGLFKLLFGSNEQSRDIPSVTSSHLDKNRIEDICYVLSWLIAEAGDSSLYVVLQDENTQKNFPQAMGVNAIIDDWHLEKLGITTINTAISYQKIGLPAEIAQFLASIPFKQEGTRSISYIFPHIPGNPSIYKNQVMDAIKRGASESRFIKTNIRNIQIEDYGGSLYCQTD